MRPETIFVVLVPVGIYSYYTLVNNIAAINSGTDVAGHLGGYIAGALTGFMLAPTMEHNGRTLNWKRVKTFKSVGLFGNILYFAFMSIMILWVKNYS